MKLKLSIYTVPDGATSTKHISNGNLDPEFQKSSEKAVNEDMSTLLR